MRVEAIEKDNIEAVAEQQEKKHQKVASIVPQNGHTLFEFNLDTHITSIAEFEKEDVVFDGEIKKGNRKVMMKPKCLYVSALNKKNAEKKFRQQLRGMMDKLYKQSNGL